MLSVSDIFLLFCFMARCLKTVLKGSALFLVRGQVLVISGSASLPSVSDYFGVTLRQRFSRR